MNSFQIRDKLLHIGLTEEECNNFSNEELLQYLRFYTKKDWQKTSITFLGFSDNEITSLLNKVDSGSLKLYKNLSKRLDFICLSEFASESQAAKAQKCDTIILSTELFLKVFQLEYKLIGHQNLYNLNVSETFRIAKPLSNFNEDIDIGSFSDANDNYYSVNLYSMKCSCAEFTTRHKSMYPIDDLRRLCKHLILLYKNTFGVYHVSTLAKCVFDEGYGLSSKFRQIKLDNISNDIIINFDQELGWWDLYVPNKKGDYVKYGYSPVEKRFSYNRKPIGIIPQLRIKLELLEKEFLGSHNKKEAYSISNKSSKGCLPVFLMFVIISVLLFVLI